MPKLATKCKLEQSTKIILVLIAQVVTVNLITMFPKLIVYGAQNPKGEQYHSS